ncbi:hypothetical protein MBLNU230_g7503t1 [Neophaeotheca triangularis]
MQWRQRLVTLTAICLAAIALFSLYSHNDSPFRPFSPFSSAGSDSRDSSPSPYSDIQAPTSSLRLHLLIPATQSNLDLCRLLLSIAVLGYPEPVLIGWADDTTNHLFKVSTILEYLEGLPPESDDDLVLIVDGYDIWFQLRPDVIIKRYYEIIEHANARLAAEGILGVPDQTGKEIRQSVLFGPDKLCWPKDDRRTACWAVPDYDQLGPNFPPWVFGPETGGWMVTLRPRWLNSGTMIGPVKDMREVFYATQERINKTYDESFQFRNSDQYYFSEIWAEQEYSRIAARDGEVVPPPVRQEVMKDGKKQFDTTAQFPTIGSGQRVEYGIGLDYDAALFQTNAGYRSFCTWITFNHTSPPSPPYADGTPRTPRIDQMPLQKDVSDSPAPFADLPPWLSNHPSNPDKNHYNLPPSSTPWSEISLGVNAITQQIFPIFHVTGDKSFRDLWWPRIWFYPWAKALMVGKAIDWEAELAIVGNTSYRPALAPGGKSLDRPAEAGKGGAWGHQGNYLGWKDTCGAFEDDPGLRQIG